MVETSRTIEIDADTAAIADRRAAEQGLTVSEFIVALVRRDGVFVLDGSADISELDRRWAAIEKGNATVDGADVERWLESWGTASFKPWLGAR